VLRIDRATYDAIVAHAREDHPDEACGVVAGPEGTERPERFVPMLNAARSPTFYEFDSADLLRLYRDMDDRDEWPVVVYHSHTATEAYPSRTDVGYASGPAADPRTHYVLVSTRQHEKQTGLAGDDVEFRSFRIVDGEVNEEEVEIVESYLFGHSPTTVVYD
jgi:proteasome lid subunit RPN8/RPN11